METSFRFATGSGTGRFAGIEASGSGGLVIGLGESSNDSARTLLGQVHHPRYDLCEMAEYPGAIAVLPDPFEKEGVGLDVASLMHIEIEYLKQNVVILWGEAQEMLHRTLESCPRRLSRKQAALPFLKCHLSQLSTLTRRYEPIKLIVSHLLKCSHKRVSLSLISHRLQSSISCEPHCLALNVGITQPSFALSLSASHRTEAMRIPKSDALAKENAKQR